MVRIRLTKNNSSSIHIAKYYNKLQFNWLFRRGKIFALQKLHANSFVRQSFKFHIFRLFFSVLTCLWSDLFARQCIGQWQTKLKCSRQLSVGTSP